MIRTWFVCAIFLCFTSAFGQLKADSLLGVWHDTTVSDSLRMNSIHVLGFKVYLTSKPDSAFICGGLEYDFAIRNSYFRNAVSGLTLQASSFAIRRQYIAAIDYYNRALNLARETDSRNVLPAIYGNMGRVFINLGLFDSALVYLNEGLDFAYEFQDFKAATTILNSIGGIHRERGDFVSAVDFFERALQTDLEKKNQRGIAFDYGNIGNVYYDQSNFKKAEEFYAKALFHYEKLKDNRGISMALTSLAGVYSALYRTDEALSAYSRAIEIQNKSGDSNGTASLLEGLSSVYIYLNDYKKGKELLDSSISIFKRIGETKGLTSAKQKLADLLYQMGDVDQAYTVAQESYQLAKKMKVTSRTMSTLELLIKINCTRGKFDETDSLVNALMDLTHLVVQQNFPVLSESEKELYLNSFSNSMDLCKSYLVQVYDKNTSALERELNSLIYFKGILLRTASSTRNSILSSEDNFLTETYNKWIYVKQRIAKVYADGEDPTELENEANELEKILVRKSTAFQEISELEELTWQDIQLSLDANESFINFFHFNEFNFETKKFTNQIVYYAFVVGKHSEYPKLIRLFTDSEIGILLKSVAGNNLTYVQNIYGTTEKRNSGLYELIWKKIDPEVAGMKTVYLSLSGLLHKVSFSAISDGNEFLCEKYNLRIIGSPEALLTEEKPPKKNYDDVMLFGGIDYNSEVTERQIWSYLPGSLSEVDKIEKLSQKVRFQKYTSLNGTESVFKNEAPKFPVIHIATHGFFYPDPKSLNEAILTDTIESKEIEFRGQPVGYKVLVNNPNPLMRSGLVFAGANNVWNEEKAAGEDGVLTALEVTDLNLTNTELVVLSACETGLGDIRGSEGVYGLQRAFKIAGVHYLIMSLWQVPDKETAEFMVTFYKFLFRTKDIHFSFNKTQQIMKDKYDPYFWAAFVLVE